MKHTMLRVGAALLLCLAATHVTSQDASSPLAHLKALRAERLSALPQAAVSTTPAKIVYVYCAKGGSISAALAKNIGPLVIEVRGICAENVRIERGDVTLHGLDPASDGIRGVVTDPQPFAAVELHYANRTRIENIAIVDSPSGGLLATSFTDVVMQNCRIEGNSKSGVYATGPSVIQMNGSVVSRNSFFGLSAFGGGYLSCVGCVVEDNARFAARCDGAASSLVLGDSIVSGTGGVFVSGCKDAYVDCVNYGTGHPCRLSVRPGTGSAKGQAVLVGSGEVYLLGVPLTGFLAAFYGSTVYLDTVQQTETTRANSFDSGSTLVTSVSWWPDAPESALLDTNVGVFSHAVLEAGTRLDGTLTCHSGGDAWADASVNTTGKVSGCEHVPAPTP